MENIGQILRRLREESGQPLRKVAAYLDMDQAILSKIERGKRKAKKGDIIKLAKYYTVDQEELLITWLASKILYNLQDEAVAGKALKLAEEQLAYNRTPKLEMKNLKSVLTRELEKFQPITRAWLFGSFARGEETHNSDVDIMIDVPDKANFSMFDVFQIQEDLQNTCNRKFDIVMVGALKSFAWETAKKDLKLIYDKSE